MTYSSIDDPEFWGRNPLQGVSKAGSYDGFEASLFLLGDPEKDPPIVAPLRMEPGYVVARHAHDCHRFEVVVQGTLDVGEGRILGPGAVMMSEPNVAYGPHIAGPEGCTTIEVFSNARGAARLTLQTLSGEMLTFDDLREPESAQAILKIYKEQQTNIRGQ